MQRQNGFWDDENRLKELSAEGDPLEKLAATVDFEVFRPVLSKSLSRGPEGKGGRPGFNPVLKFKMLVFQSLHGLSLAHVTPGCDRIGRAAHAVDATGFDVSTCYPTRSRH